MEDKFSRFRARNLPQTDLHRYLPADGVEVKFLDGCNRSCVFCVNEDHIGKVMSPIDADLFNQSLTDWLECTDEPEKPTVVYGTGGEPLMVLDLVDRVFRPLAARGIATRIVTNGTLLTPKRIEHLVDIGLSGVKVTYNTTQADRLFALMKGSHDTDIARVLEHIDLAKQAGLWVFVRIGLGRHNYDEVVKIYELMRKIDIDVLQIKPWIPSGLAARNRESLSLSPDELRSVFEGLASHIASSTRPEVTVSCYPPAREYGFTTKDCANVAKIYCEPRGRALICNFASEVLGSWYPQDGGLRAVVARRRELYSRIMDRNGVASCPARLNWSQPREVVSPPTRAAAERIPVTLGPLGKMPRDGRVIPA